MIYDPIRYLTDRQRSTKTKLLQETFFNKRQPHIDAYGLFSFALSLPLSPSFHFCFVVLLLYSCQWYPTSSWNTSKYAIWFICVSFNSHSIFLTHQINRLMLLSAAWAWVVPCVNLSFLSVSIIIVIPSCSSLGFGQKNDKKNYYYLPYTVAATTAVCHAQFQRE